MTIDKNFKKKVRERMAKTGERYTTARAALLKGTPPPLPKDTAGVMKALGADDEDGAFLSPADVDRLTNEKP